MVVGANAINTEHATNWQSTQGITSPTGLVIPCVRKSCWTCDSLCPQVLLGTWSFVFVIPAGIVILCVRRVLLDLWSYAFAIPVGLVILYVRESCWACDSVCSRGLLDLWSLCSRVLLDLWSFVFVDSLMMALWCRNVYGVSYHALCCTICILLYFIKCIF